MDKAFTCCIIFVPFSITMAHTCRCVCDLDSTFLLSILFHRPIVSTQAGSFISKTQVVPLTGAKGGLCPILLIVAPTASQYSCGVALGGTQALNCHGNCNLSHCRSALHSSHLDLDNLLAAGGKCQFKSRCRQVLMEGENVNNVSGSDSL